MQRCDALRFEVVGLCQATLDAGPKLLEQVRSVRAEFQMDVLVGQGTQAGKIDGEEQDLVARAQRARVVLGDGDDAADGGLVEEAQDGFGVLNVCVPQIGNHGGRRVQRDQVVAHGAARDVALTGRVDDQGRAGRGAVLVVGLELAVERLVLVTDLAATVSRGHSQGHGGGGSD